MQWNKFFHVVELFKVVVNLVDVPIPPFNPQKSFDNMRLETILDDFCGVAADDSIGRNIFNNDAVWGDDRTVADNQRLVRVSTFKDSTAPAPNIAPD